MQILDDAEWMVHERLKADDRYIEPWPGRDEHHDRRIGGRRHSDVTGWGNTAGSYKGKRKRRG
jgi:hypothetical protein